jgi:hypothetical protein
MRSDAVSAKDDVSRISRKHVTETNGDMDGFGDEHIER